MSSVDGSSLETLDDKLNLSPPIPIFTLSKVPISSVANRTREPIFVSLSNVFILCSSSFHSKPETSGLMHG